MRLADYITELQKLQTAEDCTEAWVICFDQDRGHWIDADPPQMAYIGPDRRVVAYGPTEAQPTRVITI